MSLSADELLDRMKLKSEVKRWRYLTILISVLLGFSILGKAVNVSGSKEDYIAKVNVSGVILESQERDKVLESLKDSEHVKAVLVYINSPGGTIVGGEKIYNSLRAIAEVKPVVAVMGSLAASGGYMAAIAADKIYTSSGTMTGSIGVMIQTAEMTELAKKLGVNFVTFKSGDLKGSPSPLEKLNPRAAKVLQASIDDGHEFFVGLVAQRRPLTKQEVLKLSDGRIYTGRQAVENKLVDAIGDEQDAIDWLVKEKNISSSLKVKNVKTKSKKNPFKDILSNVIGSDTPYISQILPSGMMAMWHH